MDSVMLSVSVGVGCAEIVIVTDAVCNDETDADAI